MLGAPSVEERIRGGGEYRGGGESEDDGEEEDGEGGERRRRFGHLIFLYCSVSL